jgi:hypothetical protein
MTDEKLSTMIEERKSKRGGARPGAGRKRRLEEHEIMMKLAPMEQAAFEALEYNLLRKDMKAVQLFYQYYMGMPTQRVESKIEGNLNQVQVEVIKPNVEVLEAATN